MYFNPRSQNDSYLGAHTRWYFGNGSHHRTRQALVAEAVQEERFTRDEILDEAKRRFAFFELAVSAIQLRAWRENARRERRNALRMQARLPRREIARKPFEVEYVSRRHAVRPPSKTKT